MKRSRKLILNTVVSLLFQITSLICGFILPRLILENFGSEVNGLINSITKFLGMITLLDLGVGRVVQSALYKPLANKDYVSISKIYVSAQKFFRRLALILFVYVVILIFLYPLAIDKTFGFIYTVTLIIAISISSFAQYYFGIVNSLLLNADQKGYITYIGQIITLILNTLVCYIIIRNGASIQIVKLTTSVIFLFRPAYLAYYVNNHYNINKKITYEEEPIKQKWSGMAQHFASFILDGTDTIVLTIMSTLRNVSIYNVYSLIITGIKTVLLSMTNGFQPLIGDMLAKREYKKLKNLFEKVECVLHFLTTLFFGCTGVLIVNFVRVYTFGINDANYIQPLFAVLITLAYAFDWMRAPYMMLVFAAGHYKQTQNNYIIAMMLNIVVSIISVKKFGLIGVAIGTLIAMLYQTIWLAWYDSKNIINWSFMNFVRHIFVDFLITVICVAITVRIPMLSISYISFFILAFEVFFCWFIVSIIINYIFFKEQFKILFKKIKAKKIL